MQTLRWPVDKLPIMIQDAKRIAIGNSRQVLEDRPDVCDSESDNDYSDHGGALEGMYSEGASLSSARMTTEQANALRTQSKGQSVHERR
jgi:hypothetical protein